MGESGGSVPDGFGTQRFLVKIDVRYRVLLILSDHAHLPGIRLEWLKDDLKTNVCRQHKGYRTVCRFWRWQEYWSYGMYPDVQTSRWIQNLHVGG